MISDQLRGFSSLTISNAVKVVLLPLITLEGQVCTLEVRGENSNSRYGQGHGNMPSNKQKPPDKAEHALVKHLKSIFKKTKTKTSKCMIFI